MSEAPGGSGSINVSYIELNQNLEANLRRQQACRTIYRRAKLYDGIGFGASLFLAFAAPIVSAPLPEVGAIVGAFAALWLFAWRIGRAGASKLQLLAASVQEKFDCAVFELALSPAASEVSEEEVRSWSIRTPSLIVRDWYSVRAEESRYSMILRCQRQSAVWSRRLHVAYGRLVCVLIGLAVCWGLIVTIVVGLSLTEYLAIVLLPSLPLILDGSDLARSHFAASAKRRQIERSSSVVLDAGNASEVDVRRVEFELFKLRSSAALVPDWFYRSLRSRYRYDMVYAAGISDV